MTRIDVELVKRGLIESRSKASYVIDKGVVFCNDKKILKHSYQVKDEDVLTIKENVLPYVSKGGLKLKKSLDEFSISLVNKNMVDIGSSTGGFSDCAIKENIKKIVAIDVGSNQFSSKVLNTGKVALYENTDFRTVENELLKNIDIACIDVSFISVLKLLDKLITLPKLKEIILLIKPQFECGKDIAFKYKGVVRNKEVHQKVIAKIITKFKDKGFIINGLTFSPILGGDGNIEYLAYFKKDGKLEKVNVLETIEFAFNKLLNKHE